MASCLPIVTVTVQRHLYCCFYLKSIAFVVSEVLQTQYIFNLRTKSGLVLATKIPKACLVHRECIVQHKRYGSCERNNSHMIGIV